VFILGLVKLREAGLVEIDQRLLKSINLFALWS